jgi:hypothetical protein
VTVSTAAVLDKRFMRNPPLVIVDPR